MVHHQPIRKLFNTHLFRVDTKILDKKMSAITQKERCETKELTQTERCDAANQKGVSAGEVNCYDCFFFFFGCIRTFSYL